MLAASDVDGEEPFKPAHTTFNYLEKVSLENFAQDEVNDLAYVAVALSNNEHVWVYDLEFFYMD